MSKYGVWNDLVNRWGSHIGYWCSNCGEYALDIQEEPYRSQYCPHCGAKMMNAERKDGGENG